MIVLVLFQPDWSPDTTLGHCVHSLSVVSCTNPGKNREEKDRIQPHICNLAIVSLSLCLMPLHNNGLISRPPILGHLPPYQVVHV